MKVKVITSFINAPEEVLQCGWSKECDAPITEGREYTVFAISVFKQHFTHPDRLIYFHIINDANLPSSLPAFLFEVVDRSLPPDWECNLLGLGTLVMGPSFICESDEAFDAMEDQEPEAMRKLRARQREIEGATQ